MMPIRPKNPRVKLERDDYDRLRIEILERDSWRCQNCGARKHLEVHHQQFRSQMGDDSEENLITICATCHQNEHQSARR